MTDAPELINVDTTSEDEDGVMICSRPDQNYVNADKQYVRRDLYDAVVAQRDALREENEALKRTLHIERGGET